MSAEIKHYDLSVDGNESTLFAVMDSGEIIGSCMLFLDGWVQDFHVSISHCGGGVGTYLLKSLEKVARQKGIKKLEGLVNPKNTALKFWCKKGFSPVLKKDGYWIKKELEK